MGIEMNRMGYSIYIYTNQLVIKHGQLGNTSMHGYQWGMFHCHSWWLPQGIAQLANDGCPCHGCASSSLSPCKNVLWNPRQRPVFQESFIKSETSARVGTGFSIMPWISGFEAHSKVQANLVKLSAVIGWKLNSSAKCANRRNGSVR